MELLVSLKKHENLVWTSYPAPTPPPGTRGFLLTSAEAGTEKLCIYIYIKLGLARFILL